MLTLINNQEIRKRRAATQFLRHDIRKYISDLKYIISSVKLNNNINKYTLACIFVIAFILMSFSMSKITFSSQKGLANLELHNDIVLEDLLFNYMVVSNEPVNIEQANEINHELLKPISLRQYKIKDGDALSKIAKEYNVSLGTLISYNDIRDAKRIKTGAIIKIPDINGVPYKIRKGDSLSIIAKRFNVKLNDILDSNNLDTAVIKPGQEIFIPGAAMSKFDLKKALGELFIYPAFGKLTSGFGYRNDPFTGLRRMHYGIDLANKPGTLIKSSMDGVVKVAGESKLYGKYVVVSHARGFQTLYAHLSKVSVKKSQRVSQGQKIGEMGSSGRSTGTHLHFSVYKNQQPINPLSQLN